MKTDPVALTIILVAFSALIIYFLFKVWPIFVLLMVMLITVGVCNGCASFNRDVELGHEPLTPIGTTPNTYQVCGIVTGSRVRRCVSVDREGNTDGALPVKIYSDGK